MISRAVSNLVVLFFLLCEQVRALKDGTRLYLFLKSVLQKWMACYKSGYKVWTGVREGHFLLETEFLKSPSLSFFAKMVGGVKIST